ncbi:hypothetical protein ACK6D9_05780 [Hoeflea sp. Naph1]|uniref:hypothetical protein n=1 Tax=Hoeflea sp. Naph1 TaxID=3388653 RepID=UPI003990237A
MSPNPGKFQFPLTQNRGALQPTPETNSKLDKTWGKKGGNHENRYKDLADLAKNDF